jgi:hypothetical protein
VATFDPVTRPSTNEDGLYTRGLRFGDPRVVAVLATLVGFCYLLEGFTNHQLVHRVRGIHTSATPVGKPPLISGDGNAA